MCCSKEKILVFFFAVLIFTMPILSQNTWTHLGLNQGLDNLIINKIDRDSEGFIWVATNGGLKRYDGESFITIQAKGFPFLANSTITDFSLDSLGIWLAVQNRGLFYYGFQLQDIEFKPIKIDTFDILNINKISSFKKHLFLSCYRHGAIRVSKEINAKELPIQMDLGGVALTQAIHDSLVLINANGAGIITSTTLLNHRSDPIIRSIDQGLNSQYTCDKTIQCDSTIYLACWDNALHAFSINHQQFKSYLLPNENEISFNSNEIYAIEQFGNQLIIATKLGALYYFDLKKKVFSALELDFFKGKTIRHLFIQDDLLWVSTKLGIYVGNLSQNVFETFPVIDEEEKPLSINKLTQYQNEIIIGSSRGAFTFDLPYCKPIAEEIMDQSIHALISDKQSLYIGTNKSVFEFQSQSQNIRNVFDKEIVRAYPNYFNPREIEFSRYNSLAIQETSIGRILWAEPYGHFPSFSILNSKWAGYTELLGEVKENLINKILVDNENKLHFLSKRDGLYEDVEFMFIECENDPTFESLPFKKQCTLEFVTLRSKSHWNLKDFPELQSNNITSLNIIGETKYLGTTAGMHRIDADHRIEVLKLPYNDITESIEWKGYLWMLSNGRLQMYNPRTSRSRIYGQNDGLPEEMVITSLFANEDQLYLGSKGLLAKAEIKNLIKSDSIIHQLKIVKARTIKNNRDIHTYNLKYAEKENGIVLSFATLKYPHSRDLNYQYKLPSVHSDWINNGRNNDLLLPNLKSGDHEILIKASNDEGQTVSSISQYLITITPHWYKTWWFYTFMLLASSAFLITLYRWRVKSLLAVSKMRNDISHDLHDDIGSILSSISIYAEAAQTSISNENKDTAKSILKTIGDQARLTIDKMGDIVWSIHANKDSKNDLLERMELFGNSLCTARSIRFIFSTKGSSSGKMNMKLRKNMYLIFKESMSNAIRHGRPTEIKVNVLFRGTKISMTIEDDGVGFNLDERKFNGFGLSTMEKRAKELNAIFQIQSSENGGTRISLTI